MTFFDDKAFKDNKFVRNLQLAIIGMIVVSLLASRLFTGIITPENALFFILVDGTIVFVLTWYVIYVYRNF